MAAHNPYVGPKRSQWGSAFTAATTTSTVCVICSSLNASSFCIRLPVRAKTSLIQAGLLRELQEKEGFRVCLVRGFRGGHGASNRYLGNVFEALDGALPVDYRKEILPGTRLEEYLKTIIKVATEGAQHGSELVLIFDQFEEIFTLDPFDRDAKAEFFRELGQALKDRTRWALFSMREDHIAALDDYLHLLPTQLKTRYRLGLLERPQAREAIEQQAGKEGVKYAMGAADMLIDDLCQVRWQTQEGGAELRKGHVVEPVQLQVVSRRLWEHRFPQTIEPPATISEDDVRLVSVDRALEDFYADKARAAAHDAHTPERDLREWVGKLITPQGLRGQVMWEPQKSGGLINEAIEGLEDAHIVRLETRGDHRWYELTHDRLLKPIMDNNRTWWEKISRTCN